MNQASTRRRTVDGRARGIKLHILSIRACCLLVRWGRCLRQQPRGISPLPQFPIDRSLSDAECRSCFHHVALANPNGAENYIPFEILQVRNACELFHSLAIALGRTWWSIPMRHQPGDILQLTWRQPAKPRRQARQVAVHVSERADIDSIRRSINRF